GHEHPKKAHALHLVDDLRRITARVLEISGDRFDASLDERTDRGAESGLLFVQLDVHAQLLPTGAQTGRLRPSSSGSHSSATGISHARDTSSRPPIRVSMSGPS